MKGIVPKRRNAIRVIGQEVPGPRVCARGCSPDEQPIANFYTRTDCEGAKRWDYVCKECVKREQRAKNALRPKGPPKKRGGAMERMEDLTGLDLIPCAKCGLRGHAPGDVERCPAEQARSTGLGARGLEWSL